MKKLSLLFALIAICGTVMAQKHVEKKVNYFVDETVKEYNLSEDHKSDLHEFYSVQAKAVAAINKEVKAGNKTKEEAKVIYKKNNQELTAFLSKMTGKTKKELRPFLDRVREEMKSVK